MQRVETMNRREALKLLGISGMGLMGSNLSAETKLSMPSSKKHARIVIAGGGTAGMIAAARVRRAAPNARIIMISPNIRHLYQSGQLWVAAGLSDGSDYVRKTTDLLPDGVTWLRESVTAFDPDHNSVTASKSGKVVYDILIVALGAAYDYESIEGLDTSMIGKEGIASVYYNDTIKGEAQGGFLSRGVFAKLQEEARRRHVEFLCTEPDTPVKGEGTTLSLLFLGNDRLHQHGVNKRVRFTLAKAGEELFASPLFRKRLQKEVERYDNIRQAYGFSLRAIDIGAKKARFNTPDGTHEMPYDFIHIVPPHRAPKVLADSPLAVQEGKERGWMANDGKNLRHPKYKNVFGIGDILAGTPGKSGGAAQHQGIILQDNIAAALEEKSLPYSYDGYTVAPIITKEGKILMAEYNSRKVLPTLPLDPMESRKFWWYFQKDFMPWLYFNMLMRGMM